VPGVYHPASVVVMVVVTVAVVLLLAMICPSVIESGWLGSP
jgi:hypothetical protein